MTDFEHKPYDKIYVRDMIKLSLDDSYRYDVFIGSC